LPQPTRLAIVTPWFGTDLRGGAEQQSWQLAEELAVRGHAVDVLTTCCASFNDDWGRNTLAAGIERRGNVTVRRFKVSKRDRRAFNRVNAILMALRPADLRRSVSPLGDDDARAFYENNINSEALYAYLSSEGDKYSHVLFLPYLYGPTLFGLPLVADRAYLQPCLHEESYAFLTRVAEVAHMAKGLLLNSNGELELATRLFGPGILKKSHIVGEGVSAIADLPSGATRVGGFTPAGERYILYLGRQDGAKNVPMIVQAFAAFRRRQPTSQLKLVLAGERPVSYGDSTKAILDLGPVSEPEKAALLAHCRGLVQPSLNESFSRVIYEAWTHGRPVIVHADCLPTQSAVAASGGGFVASTVASWEDALIRIDTATDRELNEMGARGRSYAREVSSWPTVIARYERYLGLSADTAEQRSSIWQIVPAEGGDVRRYADALALSLRRLAVDVVDATPESAAPPPGALAIRHERIDGAPFTYAHANSLILHEFGADVVVANGRAKALAQFASTGTRGFASTPRALEELERAGFHEPELLPICVDPRIWDCLPDLPLASALQDGKHNLVYVGRVTELAHLDQLLIAFLHYLTIEREARLTIIASGTIDDAVYARLFEEVQRLELMDRVLISRSLTPAQLQSVYRAADVFVSLDESEDLGENFLQAMWFDIPIVAYKSAVAQWLVGPAGILINDTRDLLAIAALAQTVVTDGALRAQIIAAQRVVRASLDEGRAAQRIAQTIAKG
jgi:glycosyltransferase involved in cell wall biosynthesis